MRDGRVPGAGDVVLPGQLAGVLQRRMAGDRRGRAVRRGRLGDVITSISKALSDSASALLPLAPLKRHDEYTFVHTINVAILSTALGEAVGFTGRDAHDLSLAALLHDVGKRIIPHDLLNKSGRFTDEEFRLVQLHPVEGARMLLATPGVPELAPIVAYEHHVRADGSGYPKLPRAGGLSLASRIVQVADVFDALRTHRPYRPALPLPEILEIMRKDAGVFFDADLLDVFFSARGLARPARARAVRRRLAALALHDLAVDDDAHAVGRVLERIAVEEREVGVLARLRASRRASPMPRIRAASIVMAASAPSKAQPVRGRDRRLEQHDARLRHVPLVAALQGDGMPASRSCGRGLQAEVLGLAVGPRHRRVHDDRARPRALISSITQVRLGGAVEHDA